MDHVRRQFVLCERAFVHLLRVDCSGRMTLGRPDPSSARGELETLLIRVLMSDDVCDLGHGSVCASGAVFPVSPPDFGALREVDETGHRHPPVRTSMAPDFNMSQRIGH